MTYPSLSSPPPAERPGPAAPRDIDGIVALHTVCFGERFMGFLGARYLRRFYGFMMRDGEAVVQVARAEDGAVVGFVAGVINRRGFYRRFLWSHRVGVAVDVACVLLARPGRLPRVLGLARRSRGGTDYSADAFLLALGVHPDWRRYGMARRLLAAFGDALHARGVTAYALTTEADENDVTNHFYRKMGFELVRTFEPRGRAGRVNEYRRTLSQSPHDNSDHAGASV